MAARETSGERVLYWGILHCHVQGSLCHKKAPFSEAELTELDAQIDRLYKFARDDRKFDFLVYADHDSMGNMISLGNVEGSPWKMVMDKTVQYTEPGRFIALPGYEYQDGMEYNVYLHGTEQLPHAATWQELMAQVVPGDPGVILAAHNRPSPTDWRFPHHDNFRLIEILNEGSVFEGWANSGLRAGHAAGFIGGSDDHGCHPGRNACTGVWADELSADAIWDGLRARRTVAATGIRPSIIFKANGFPMGSTIDPADTYRVEVSHRFSVRPILVMLIADGRLVLEKEVPDANFEFTEELSGTEISGCRTLYLKFLYPDGNMAFASPFFVAGANRCAITAEMPKSNVVTESGASAGPGVTLRESPCVEEFGERVGWHNYVNANPLLPEAYRPMQQIRDMLIHTGPDALLVRRSGAMVVPTMDGFCEFAADRQAVPMHEFSGDENFRLFTALVEAGDSVVAAGYLGAEPGFLALCGSEPVALRNVLPIRPYIYRDRLVTPRYLAGDGRFLAALAEHECTILVPSGKVLAFCQVDYPAFPCSVAMNGLGCIVVLGCDGTVVLYDASASQSAVVRWKRTLPEGRSGVTIMGDEIWCYNRSFAGCYPRKPIEISVLDAADGSIRGVIRPDLVNIRGTTICPVGDDRFAALHNPNLNGAAAFRHQLNLNGTVRVFKR